jgi:hypothetical protein
LDGFFFGCLTVFTIFFRLSNFFRLSITEETFRISRYEHLVHQNWYRISFAFSYIGKTADFHKTNTKMGLVQNTDCAGGVRVVSLVKSDCQGGAFRGEYPGENENSPKFRGECT